MVKVYYSEKPRMRYSWHTSRGLDGGFVRNAEGTLWLETNQGKDEIDRNPVHF